ncbi:MAG TPA: hypothetical protein VIH63_09020 [Xanthobacteraceae bacterium]
MFRYRSSQHSIDVFQAYYGPLAKTFAAFQPPEKATLLADFSDRINRQNPAKHGSMVALG